MFFVFFWWFKLVFDVKKYVFWLLFNLLLVVCSFFSPFYIFPRSIMSFSFWSQNAWDHHGAMICLWHACDPNLPLFGFRAGCSCNILQPYELKSANPQFPNSSTQPHAVDDFFRWPVTSDHGILRESSTVNCLLFLSIPFPSFIVFHHLSSNFIIFHHLSVSFPFSLLFPFLRDVARRCFAVWFAVMRRLAWVSTMHPMSWWSSPAACCETRASQRSWWQSLLTDITPAASDQGSELTCCDFWLHHSCSPRHGTDKGRERSPVKDVEKLQGCIDLGLGEVASIWFLSLRHLATGACWVRVVPLIESSV